ncbi:hypothetical protein QJS10_CPB19g00717 [Acorus calamus]|uniref:Uncharacterized protein n=1 Tax=Acorus calamus TaxID=4465 RepID=A0AAV9CF29_ACOCL|nr:hypothetical protein QJS10_CPB19g00717 [Acorus calamus]
MTSPSTPTSPRLPPVDISGELVEGFLRFTISSAMDGNLEEVDLGFSKQYLSDLLREEDQGDLSSGVSDGGFPNRPLYKRLALAIHGRVSAASEGLVGTEEWDQSIVNGVSELVDMLRTVDFEIHVQEPYFSLLKAGSVLLVDKCMLLEVQHVKKYDSFFEMLEVENLNSVLPGVESIDEGVLIYRKFYTEEKEKANGVLAICVSKPVLQPYFAMATILSGLGYDGVGALLGMKHTPGTILDALPPPRSSLLSSFMAPHRPDVKGSTLIDGARALAKHVNRSKDGWWGSFRGSGSPEAMALDGLKMVHW